MGDKLEVRYVPLSTAVIWDNNPKKHDLGGIAASIAKYGFKDPAKWEPALNGGQGGLGHGNGRIRALFAMKAQGQQRPRGILEDERTGEWLVPILFGVDAESQAAAEAYAIDHNNLTMAGGDFSLFQIAQMYDDSLPSVLARLAAQEVVPVTMDGDDIDRLLAASQVMEELGNLAVAVGAIGADEAVIGFSFGEFKLDVPFALYAKFCEVVMKLGSVEQVLTGWLDTAD